MKTIVRIEHPLTGDGLFRTTIDEEYGLALWRKLSFANDLEEKHEAFPTPTRDGLPDLWEKSDYYCAFKSLDQFEQWINRSWCKEILELGFKILLIDVSEYLEGEYQIIFKKEHILQSKDISDLFK